MGEAKATRPSSSISGSFCEGDTVAIQAVNVGTFKGVKVEQPVALFFEIEDEKITSVTVYYDRLGLREAIGPSDAH